MAMNLCIVAYVAAPLFAPRSLSFHAVDAVSVLAPVLFWLFARLWFDDRAHIGWRGWILVGGYALVPAIQLTLLYTTGRISLALWIVARVGMFALAIAGVWIAWRGRADDLVEGRRALRLLVVGAIGLFTLWVTTYEMFRHDGERHDLGHVGTLLAILVAILGVSMAMYRFRPADLFAAPAPPKEVVPTAAEPVPPDPSPFALRLLAVMADERPYRAEGFSIAALAQRLGEPEYRVRRTINGELGYRNFTAFLNLYRLAEVRAALADPAQCEVPILTIALDAGFGSIGPFNRAFREAEDMTPSEFRARRLADSGIS
jgi:AraC-like DNA-binding protein